ncbi:unnamed protein product [Ceratitis capitata]|uniref:(Mediterranean fruit fly) hypothetical protein n=1 Tax=Ceratitis capitata TaxID=7213 RepID=A0A811U1A0_CERCA|nr:unnamed protein product [Ceratitis capitata]
MSDAETEDESEVLGKDEKQIMSYPEASEQHRRINRLHATAIPQVPPFHCPLFEFCRHFVIQ